MDCNPWTAGFTDNHNPQTTATSIAGGESDLVWTISSRYGACLTTTDTMQILRDRIPNPANAGPDRGVCDSLVIVFGCTCLPETEEQEPGR